MNYNSFIAQYNYLRLCLEQGKNLVILMRDYEYTGMFDNRITELDELYRKSFEYIVYYINNIISSLQFQDQYENIVLRDLERNLMVQIMVMDAEVSQVKTLDHYLNYKMLIAKLDVWLNTFQYWLDRFGESKWI